METHSTSMCWAATRHAPVAGNGSFWASQGKRSKSTFLGVRDDESGVQHGNVVRIAATPGQRERHGQFLVDVVILLAELTISMTREISQAVARQPPLTLMHLS